MATSRKRTGHEDLAREALGRRSVVLSQVPDTAAEAGTHINEAVTGICEEMGDIGMAMQRAEDKTAQMQARAGALDELIASGALAELT